MNCTAYKFEVLVLDFENSGLDDLIASIENNKYNVVKVKSVQSRPIYNWTDEHPLNQHATQNQAYLELFKE